MGYGCLSSHVEWANPFHGPPSSRIFSRSLHQARQCFQSGSCLSPATTGARKGVEVIGYREGPAGGGPAQFYFPPRQPHHSTSGVEGVFQESRASPRGMQPTDGKPLPRCAWSGISTRVSHLGGHRSSPAVATSKAGATF